MRFLYKKYLPASFLAICCLLFVSCDTNKESAPAGDSTIHAAIVADTTQIIAATTDSVPIAPYPDDSINPEAFIFNTTGYHGDEVPANIGSKKFYGLFQNAAGFYLDTTTVNTSIWYDPIVDDDSTKPTGIELKTSNPDTNRLLISGIDYLKTGKITTANITNLYHEPRAYTHIKHGDSLRFVFEGKTYVLFATGYEKQHPDLPLEKQVFNYRLFISGLKKGQPVTQLLTAQPQFDDAQIEILFCGDIDGDHLPDFIIDTTNHYNVFQPTLYLSGKAGANQLLKMVAKHTSVGC